MRLQDDAWLGGVLGVRAARLCVDDTAPGVAAAAFRETCLALRGSRAFVYAKVGTGQVALVGGLCDGGMQVVDVNVTFDREVRPVESARREGVQIVRELSSGDEQSVLDIAETAFVFSRFHLDPRIPRPLANACKREWVSSYLRGTRGEELMVLKVADQPAGFLAVLVATQNGRRVRVIDLIGVAERFQGQGLGQKLVEEFVTSSVGKAELVKVGTQVVNTPSIRLYERCGFRLAESCYVLHAHLDASGEVR
jgi:ribosomal protein S18 acetylase RimI-like enzyme